MTTMNISVTKDQAKFIDNLVSKLDFSNRSEFFRAIIRLISQRPEIIAESSTLPFVSPSTKSKSTILKELEATGKYSKAFLKDIKEGLDEDVYFNQK